MIYNDKLTNSYGVFTEIRGGSSISKYKKLPSDQDYKDGYVERYFVKKINENIIIEIDRTGTSTINLYLYKLATLKWKISGPKNNIYKNNILEKDGVEEFNKFEIERVKKEEGVDLSSTLPNLLEYWRGR